MANKKKTRIRQDRRSDRVLTEKDLAGEMSLDDFEYKGEFSLVCELFPDRKNERLLIEHDNDELINKRGVLYLFVLGGKLIKIGSTTTSFKDRVSSYNCGKRAYRANGTCSTTNYFVLQNLLNINKKVQVYCYFPESIKFKVFGERETISLPAKSFEKKLLTHLKKEGKFPIMCTQQ